jgi:hypothetical protein
LPECVESWKSKIEAVGEEATFRVGANSVQDGELSMLLSNLAIQHCEFAQELQRTLERLGGLVTTTDAPRRSGDARETDYVEQDDCTILGECEAIDAVAFQKFSVAHQRDLPEPARGVIGNQYSVLKSAHEHLQHLVIDRSDCEPSAHSHPRRHPKIKK